MRAPQRCGWCGVFIRRGTKPTLGANAFGTPVGQTLCPGCVPEWIDLTDRNMARLETHPDGMDYVIEAIGGIR